jgi:hypothetical protein
MNKDPGRQVGWSIWLIGWVLFFSSFGFTLANKSARPQYVAQSWGSIGLLMTVAAGYLIARGLSARWRSVAVRRYVSPYLVGATCWLVLLAAFLGGSLYDALTHAR